MIQRTLFTSPLGEEGARRRREGEGTPCRNSSASSTKYPHPPMLRMGPSLSQRRGKNIRAVIFIIATVIFFAPILLPSLALASRSDVQKEPIPKEFIKVNIPYGVSPIDLRGMGKADDLVILGGMTSVTANPDVITFLTKADNGSSEKYHFVEMPDIHGDGGASLHVDLSDVERECSMRHTLFMRDAANPKQLYLLTTFRAPYIEPNIGVKFDIGLYRLAPERAGDILIENGQIEPMDNIYYIFLPVREVSIQPKNFSPEKCQEGYSEACGDLNAACSSDEIEKLEQDTLKIKVRK